MKKMIVAVLFGVLALTGCNEKGDNGELAGVYQSENKDQMILTYIKGNEQYKVDYRQYFDLSKVNKYAKPQYKNPIQVGYAIRENDFLIDPSEQNKKFFKIENNGLKSVYNNQEIIYVKTN
ncbi:hypothetical protein QN092_21475 (plasmid) [Proteus vulgaris]|uniref:hypothetical protein n=1 Tax=Proteus vulgaris TaxID=585 RepID=UPI0025409B2E|nr:hypothetical protein [Proteus vulgaris]WIF74483.1 hypothetical protein QN092_21475 [Proteus vulgaris]